MLITLHKTNINDVEQPLFEAWAENSRLLLYDLEAAGGDRDYIMHGSAAWSQFMVGARP